MFGQEVRVLTKAKLENEKLLADVKATLAKKDADIAQLEESYQARGTELGKLQHENEAEHAEIKSMRQELAKKDDDLARVSAAEQALMARVEELQSQAAGNQAEIQQLTHKAQTPTTDAPVVVACAAVGAVIGTVASYLLFARGK